MKSRSNVFAMAIVGLVGAIIGSFSMMLFASTHFAGVAGAGNTPPTVQAALLPAGSGTTDQDRIINAVKRVQPSVVALQVTVNGTQLVPADPLAQFFGGGGPAIQRRVVERASGSGFVYSRDGFIITNAHVVPQGTSKVLAVFSNGDRVPARVYSRNPAVDLALVKVDGYAKLPPPVEFADASRLQAGQWAIAIGEPIGLQKTVTVGVVSAFNREEPIANDNGQLQLFRGLLQTSAPINPGNSGGPLIDYDGRVIGVNQSTAANGVQGIGFAIPANTVTQAVAQLAQNQGKTLQANSTGTGKAYFGIAPLNITNQVRTQLGGYHGAGGVAVQNVQDGTPAANAGIQAGDVIQSINGKAINTETDFRSTIAAMKPGDRVTVRLWSNGVQRTASVTLGEQPAELYLQQQQQQSP